MIQHLKLKRIKRKSDMPDLAHIFCINHVYLDGQKFKIYKNGGSHHINNSELYLKNCYNGKWYQIINEVIE